MVHLGYADGELYDLHEDPGQQTSKWNHPEAQTLKPYLLLKPAHAEIEKGP